MTKGSNLKRAHAEVRFRGGQTVRDPRQLEGIRGGQTVQRPARARTSWRGSNRSGQGAAWLYPNTARSLRGRPGSPNRANEVRRGSRSSKLNRARESSSSRAKSHQRFGWTYVPRCPSFCFVAGKGNWNGDIRPERVGPEPERGTGASYRAPPARGGVGPERGYRKRPSGRARVEGHLAGRLRPAGGTRTVERPLVPTESASRGRDRRTGNTPRGRKLPRGFSRPGPFRPFDYTLRHGMARRFIE